MIDHPFLLNRQTDLKRLIFSPHNVVFNVEPNTNLTQLYLTSYTIKNHHDVSMLVCFFFIFFYPFFFLFPFVFFLIFLYLFFFFTGDLRSSFCLFLALHRYLMEQVCWYFIKQIPIQSLRPYASKNMNTPIKINRINFKSVFYTTNKNASFFFLGPL